MTLTRLLKIWVEAEGPGGVRAGARGERGPDSAGWWWIRGSRAPGQSRALLAAPGPTPAWPSLVGGLSVWCRPQSLGLASGGCPEGPPLISHRSRWVLGPPTLAGLGLRDPWLQGAQGCPWNPREQRGGREAGSRWARRGGGHSLHPSPSPLRARGVLGVREGWPFRSSRPGLETASSEAQRGHGPPAFSPAPFPASHGGRGGLAVAMAICGEGGLALGCSSRGLSWGLGDVCVHQHWGPVPRLMLAM